MSAGKGYTALAALILAKWRSVPAPQRQEYVLRSPRSEMLAQNVNILTSLRQSANWREKHPRESSYRIT